jgi:hypothetical protein
MPDTGLEAVAVARDIYLRDPCFNLRESFASPHGFMQNLLKHALFLLFANSANLQHRLK